MLFCSSNNLQFSLVNSFSHVIDVRIRYRYRTQSPGIYSFMHLFTYLFNIYFWVLYLFSSVWSLSHVQLFGTPWTAACQASLSITNSRSFLKFMSSESVMLSNHLILYHPFLLLPSIFPSIRVFSNESVLRIRWPKYWSFSFSISPTNEYSGLISFRIDWSDLLAVQGILKSLLQHHSSKSHHIIFINTLKNLKLWKWK